MLSNHSATEYARNGPENL